MFSAVKLETEASTKGAGAVLQKKKGTYLVLSRQFPEDVDLEWKRLWDSMSVQSWQQLKDSDDDERVLTVAKVIGKVEPSAKKAAAWTDEEFKSVVEAHAETVFVISLRAEKGAWQ